jgi:hypothetical protein
MTLAYCDRSLAKRQDDKDGAEYRFSHSPDGFYMGIVTNLVIRRHKWRGQLARSRHNNSIRSVFMELTGQMPIHRAYCFRSIYGKGKRNCIIDSLSFTSNSVLMNSSPLRDEQDDEISLGDIIEFLIGEWRKLAAGAVAGLVLALGGTLLFAQYKAEATVANANLNTNTSNNSNNSNNNSNNNNNNVSQPPIDFLSWKYLQKALPELARRAVELKKASPEDEKLYKTLSSPKWWEKNVEPNFAFSKADQKTLAAVGKDLAESAGSTILFFTITDSAPDKVTAEANLAKSIHFMRTASTYWALSNLIRTIDSSISNSDAQLLKSIGATEIELDYLAQKAQGFESLRKRYPNRGVGDSRQVIDVKEGGAKYLPLDTQLVAVNTDIMNARETLTRMHDKQKQHAVIKTFLQTALPALEENIDGLALGNFLLGTIADLRKKLSLKDRMQQQALGELESDVASILVRFDKGLRVSVAPEASKTSGLLKSGALGVFGGGTLMLLFVMGRSAWLRSRKTARPAE